MKLIKGHKFFSLYQQRSNTHRPGHRYQLIIFQHYIQSQDTFERYVTAFDIDVSLRFSVYSWYNLWYFRYSNARIHRNEQFISTLEFMKLFPRLSLYAGRRSFPPFSSIFSILFFLFLFRFEFICIAIKFLEYLRAHAS